MALTQEELAAKRLSESGVKLGSPSTDNEEQEQEQEIDNDDDDDKPGASGSGGTTSTVIKEDEGSKAGEKEDKGLEFVFDPDQITDEQFESLLNKRSGGQLSKLDDLKEKLTHVKPANDILAKANEYASKGGDVMQWFESQKTDWKTVPAEEKAYQKFKSEFPDTVPDDVLKEAFADRFKTDQDEDSREYKVGQANLLKFAKEWEDQKIAEQVIAQVPPAEIEAAKRNNLRKEASQEWDKRIDTALGSFKALKVDLGDGKTFDHIVKDGPLLQSLKSSLKDVDTLNTIVQSNKTRYSGNDGVQKLVEDLYFMENKQAIMNDLLSAKQNSTMSDFVDKNLKGAGSKNKNAPNGGGNVPDIKQQIRQGMSAKRG